MKSKFLFIALLIATVVFIAACGGGSSSKSQQDIAADSQGATVLITGTAQGISPTSGTRGQQYTCSGWVDSELGQDLVVTDAHCLGAPIIQVGPNHIPATVVGVDALNDIAVISAPGVSAGGTFELADEAPAQGDTVYTLGYPGNGSVENPAYQVTEGTVTALNLGSIQLNADDFGALWDDVGIPNDNAILALNGLMQTTSPTTHGGSGGPVVNDQGEVVGMTETGSSEGEQNDATNWDTLNRILPQLAAGDNNGYIGITMSAVPTDYLDYLGVSDGVFFVSYIEPNSSVDAELGYLLRQASTKYGAYLAVTSINGQYFKTQQELLNFLATIQTGQEVRLSVFALSLDATLAVDLGEVRFTAP